ncbi:urate hydroxylase PuuD [Cupriavidus gilardii]|uniref:Urate hydroxylase PuuD n=1 Tax=Cupriavidus gilardii TaxID=82541 RepID=A0ABY4VPW9_9BURK|nr:urate hydroxylase PuuD [Cupriavidus gilardii]QQE07593.1 urate hydroxylase PuuD [Cupriavidus sp. ISTL7]MCT9074652.1 urate hydroxylase PuuD [Cupriavidus gilardii]MCT9118699.1 urate hydroxylase PuuD [Cupriavidus gilardii]MCT9125709.1 urate hydroxylase PuuD [Cupriavidus gilardii]QKS63186.1 urate hydroxylase PuuD [Cupriavidus gilardii]
MEGYILDWANLLLRWAHVITAIAWIGSSFYFVWLDNSLQKPVDPDLVDKGVGGELWAVHGGGFYNPQKYLTAPKKLPENLHWFYWESYSTWMTGFALLVVLYLFNASTFLIDKNVYDMSPGAAVGLAIAYLAVGWVVYDCICRVFGKNDRVVGILVALYVVLAAYVACHMFSGRAAFLLTGAMIATIMSANVLVWIIPGQRKTVAAMREGKPVDPIHGKNAKQRSVHNTYFTLPVLFAMLSNHYSMTYAHKYNWVVLVLIMLAGVLIRQFFILKHKGKINVLWPAAGVAALGVVAVMIAPQPRQPVAAQPDGAAATKVSFTKVQEIMNARCVQCHAEAPKMMPTAAKGIKLETPDEIKAHAQLIYQQAVQQKAMPLGNVTQITDDERALLGQWFEAGASTTQ